MSKQVQTAVARWRVDSFRTTDLSFEAAVRSLHTEQPAVEAKRTGPREWLVSTLHIMSFDSGLTLDFAALQAWE